MPVLPVTWTAPVEPSRQKVRRIQPSGREQQIGQSIDGDAEVFLGPWISPVVTAQSRFDMRDGNACQCSAERAAECAGRVALHDDQRCALAMAGPIVRATSLAWENGSGCPPQPSSVVASVGMP